jgi:hypothetical protein
LSKIFRQSLRGGLPRRRRRHEEGPLPATSYFIFFGRPYQACSAEGFRMVGQWRLLRKRVAFGQLDGFHRPPSYAEFWPITGVANFQLSADCTSCLEAAEMINTNTAFTLSYAVRCIHGSPQTDPAPQFPLEAPKNFGTEIHEIKVS